jgi:hypothetical protein
MLDGEGTIVIRICPIMALSMLWIIFEKLFLCKQSHLVGFGTGWRIGAWSGGRW